MCEPISASIAVATVAHQLYSQDQAFKAEAANQEARHEVEAERAQRDAEISRTMLNQQALEQSTEIQQDRQRLALEALRERGSQRASGAESGLGGVSSIRSMLSTDLNEGAQASNINMNASNNLFRNQMEQSGININYQDRLQNSQTAVDNAKRQKLGAMDYLGAGLSGVGAGMQIYGKMPNKPNTGKTTKTPTVVDNNKASDGGSSAYSSYRKY